jgi:hypothetical protein
MTRALHTVENAAVHGAGVAVVAITVVAIAKAVGRGLIQMYAPTLDAYARIHRAVVSIFTIARLMCTFSTIITDVRGTRVSVVAVGFLGAFRAT